MSKKFIVAKDYHNSRFDKWFKQNVFNIPQSLIEKIIRKNKVKVNKKKTKTSYRVQFHDIIEIHGINKIKSNDGSKKIKYKPSEKEKSKYDNFILENNNNFIIINKPSGIPVQAGTKSFKNIIDTLKNTKYFKDTRPFVVHRLDKETSGILIVAKNREYAQLFTSLFRIRKIHKTYLAITYGEVPENVNLLEDDLISYDNNKKIVQKAISYLKILKSNGQYSLLELNPITGRKHQLRKQLYNIGNPIIGDKKYFVKKHINKTRSKNLMLHAHKIKFMINNVKYNFKAKYNEEFEDFIKRKF
jgi:23S rRNA pseudouridine955/2504/2580 synthase